MSEAEGEIRQAERISEPAAALASPAKTQRNTVCLAAILLTVATLAVYWQITGFDYIMTDDTDYVVHNVHVRSGLTPENMHWAFNVGYMGNWHPATWMSHMLDVELYGVERGNRMGPGGHHLTALLLHVANTLLLFLFLARTTKRVWPSAFVAALFALHPLHVESVAWVSERKDVLSAFFMLLCMLAYSWYVERPNIRKYLLVSVLFGLGLMSKQMLVSLPILLLLIDYWPLNRRPSTSVRRLAIEKIPLLAMSVAASVLVIAAQSRGGAMRVMAQVPFTARASNAVVTYVLYLRDMVWPSKLAFFYTTTFGSSLHQWQAWQVAACLFVLVGLTWLAMRKRGCFAVGWLWFVISLVPVVGLLQVGSQSRANRYTYIPLIGIFMILAYALPDLFRTQNERRASAVFAGVGALAIAALIPAAYREIGYWKDSETLYSRTVAVTEKNFFVQQALACIWEDEAEQMARTGKSTEALDKSRQALRLLRESLRVSPDFGDAHNDAGRALLLQKDYDGAIEEFQKALKCEPTRAYIYNNLGTTYQARGEYALAIEQYRKSIEIDPDYCVAYYNMALALQRSGNTDAAIDELGELVKRKTDPLLSYTGLCLLGSLQASKGRLAIAIDLFRRAEEINRATQVDRRDYAARKVIALTANQPTP